MGRTLEDWEKATCTNCSAALHRHCSECNACPGDHAGWCSKEPGNIEHRRGR